MTKEERQKKATEVANENGFSTATYVGARDGFEVYLAGDDEAQCTGLPMFIAFDENDEPEEVFGFMFMDLVKE